VPIVRLNHGIEYEWLGPPPGEAPTVIMLHHGLGSVSAWRDFPAKAQQTTGAGVLVYSRYGAGNSDRAPAEGLAPDFMHHEARGDLPALLQALDVQRPIFLGQSDGASIAIIYAASRQPPEPLGLVLLAPHVVVEPCTIDSAVATRDAFQTGDLRSRLARHHADPDGVFIRWSESWLRPGFEKWNIEAEVARVRCPMTVIQGLDDQYGTTRQVDRIRDNATVTTEAILLPACGHSPQKDHPDTVLCAVARHVARVTDS
jgi:pimeloyl-ACP methyl ester carboxylesterase